MSEESYKKKYIEIKKELDMLKEKVYSPKEVVMKELALLFGDNLKERKSWTNEKTGEVNSYEAYTDFYEKLNRQSKDTILELIKKVKGVKK